MFLYIFYYFLFFAQFLPKNDLLVAQTPYFFKHTKTTVSLVQFLYDIFDIRGKKALNVCKIPQKIY